MQRLNINKQKIILFLAIILLSSFLFSEQQEITLPDVTTYISGEENVVIDSAIPDFVDVLPEEERGLPVLSDASITVNEETDVVEDTSKSSREMIYLDGSISGGFPGVFSGGFSVYRSGIENPFSISFINNSVTKYGSKDYSAGFFNQDTKLNISVKNSLTEKLDFLLSGKWYSQEYGLQNQCPVFFSLTNQQTNAKPSLVFNMNNQSSLTFSTDINYLTQYSGYIGDSSNVTLITDNPTNSYLFLYPQILYSFNHQSFSLNANVDYLLYGLVNNTLSNRIRSDVLLASAFNLFSVSAKAGIVYSEDAFVFPFSVKTEIEFTKNNESDKTNDSESSTEVSEYSKMPVKVSLEGGLSSDITDVENLILENNYSVFNILPTEESFWFGKLDLLLPFTNKLFSSISAEYKTEAFGNDFYIVDYSMQNATSGLFPVLKYLDYSTKDTYQKFVTELSFSWIGDHSSAKVGWVGSWLDVLPYESQHKIYTTLAISSSDELWQGELDLISYLDSTMPFINLRGIYCFSNSIKAVISLDDMILLFSEDNRQGYGNFIQGTESVSVSLKFCF